MKTKNFSELSPGSAIGAVDGRYAKQTRELAPIFSESALMKFRLLVEVEFLIFLSLTVKIIRPLTLKERAFLRRLYQDFSEESYQKIKEIEKKTNHDVNAVVRYLRGIIEKSSLADLTEFVHIGLTSEDVNNTAFGLMLREGAQILLSNYFEVVQALEMNFIRTYGNLPLLARTHGQPAVPTTVGWEFNVYCRRLLIATQEISNFQLSIKFGGATGGHNALYAAWPEIDWRYYSEKFVDKLNRIGNHDGRFFLGFKFNPYNTQIDNHDTYAKLFSIIICANTGLIDAAQDIWDYISREVFTQKPVAGEDGSSAMPHKVNPIDFENAEGNFGVANALFRHFSDKLPVSRLQRDLSDSTVIRNFGTAFALTLIALKSFTKGLGKIYLNETQVKNTLEEHWEVVAEAVQIILRRYGVSQSYDLLKDLTRGKGIDKEVLLAFIEKIIIEHQLPIEAAVKLRTLSPHTYLGNRRIEPLFSFI